MGEKASLKRELGLLEVTLSGVGIILGAGIYALLGRASGLAGNSLWMSFAISALIVKRPFRVPFTIGRFPVTCSFGHVIQRIHALPA